MTSDMYTKIYENPRNSVANIFLFLQRIHVKSHKRAYNSLATHAIQLKSHAKSHSSKTTHAARTKRKLKLKESPCTYAVHAFKTKILSEKS